jgi:hypothetical protein
MGRRSFTSAIFYISFSLSFSRSFTFICSLIIRSCISDFLCSSRRVFMSYCSFNAYFLILDCSRLVSSHSLQMRCLSSLVYFYCFLSCSLSFYFSLYLYNFKCESLRTTFSYSRLFKISSVKRRLRYSS